MYFRPSLSIGRSQMPQRGDSRGLMSSPRYAGGSQGVRYNTRFRGNQDCPLGLRRAAAESDRPIPVTYISFRLTNTFMERSLSPNSSVYSKESTETNFMMYRV